MRARMVVGAGAALLIGALAGVEWWAEHQWRADAVGRPPEASAYPGEIPETGLPTEHEIEQSEAAASPRLSR